LQSIHSYRFLRPHQKKRLKNHHIAIPSFINASIIASDKKKRIIMSGIQFSPTKDIPDLSGKAILVTGGTAGLGKKTVLNLVAHNPGHIYISGRNANAANTIIETVKKSHPNTNVTFIPCDLSSFDSITTAAKDIVAKTPRLDVLMCNAGIMQVPEALTREGYETQFGTNHMGHALLIKHLQPLLDKTQKDHGEARIIINTSTATIFAANAGIQYNTIKKPSGGFSGFLGGWKRYGQSKLANQMYAAELARQYPNITSVSVHPGVINTDLLKNLTLAQRAFLYVGTFRERMSLEDGVKNQLWAATTKGGNLTNGAYYAPISKKEVAKGKGSDKVAQEELWKWTQKEMEGRSL